MQGKRSAKATAPTQPALSVSVQASQPAAMRCIQVPISEIELPSVKMP